MAGFQKRTFTLRSFARSMGEVLLHPGDIRAAARGRRVSRTFAEKIMLAVTQVNDCRYCSYFHSRQALAAGVTAAEVEQLLSGELGAFPPEQTPALLFAQHYAEQSGQPDPQAWQRLVDFYGPEMARDIQAYIRMIMIGNLAGNTFDWLLYRLGLLRRAGQQA